MRDDKEEIDREKESAPPAKEISKNQLVRYIYCFYNDEKGRTKFSCLSKMEGNKPERESRMRKKREMGFQMNIIGFVIFHFLFLFSWLEDRQIKNHSFWGQFLPKWGKIHLEIIFCVFQEEKTTISSKESLWDMNFSLLCVFVKCDFDWFSFFFICHLVCFLFKYYIDTKVCPRPNIFQRELHASKNELKNPSLVS